MITRKKTPWGALLVLLMALLVLTYFICGLYKMEGVSLLNLQDALQYIFTHPFQNWWSQYTLAWFGAAFLAWVMFVGYYLDFYRNYHFGAENGSEQWADLKELNRKLRDPDEKKNTYFTQHIAVSDTALSNRNILAFGSSGTFKTTSFLTPNILLASCTNVILDIKGDLLRKHGNYLRAHGVTVKSLNLINPEESDRYNPFAYLEKDTDVIRLITNLQASTKPPDAMKGDPFWDEGVGLYLQAMFFHEWLAAKREGRQGTMNNILRLVNMETKKIPPQKRGEEEKTELQVEMDRLAGIYGPDYPPVRDYRKLKEGAAETVRSIIIMVNAMLKLCETPSLHRLLEADDIDIPSLGLGVDGNPEKKTALFLVLPDNDQSFNFFISMFYTQMFDILTRIADFKCHGVLPIHVRLWADEFYAGPKPNDPEKLLGTIRSRNMSMVLLLQSVSQLKALYLNEKWNVFMDNFAAVIFLGSGPAANDTHKFIAELLGEMTIDTRDDSTSSGQYGNHTLSNRRAGRGLMTPGEVRRMNRKYAILFLEGQYPAFDKKALPFNTPRWKESEKLAGKDGYRHPVEVLYDEKTMTYHTVKAEKKIAFLTKDEVAFYKKMEKENPHIKVFEGTGDDFLYLNWRRKPKLSEEEIIALSQEVKKELAAKQQTAALKIQAEPDTFWQEEESGEESGGRKAGGGYQQSAARTEIQYAETGTGQAGEEWDLTGTIGECILRYAGYLDEEQIGEILAGMEDGLTDREIKSYFTYPAEKMNKYRRAYLLGRG